MIIFWTFVQTFDEFSRYLTSWRWIKKKSLFRITFFKFHGYVIHFLCKKRTKKRSHIVIFVKKFRKLKFLTPMQPQIFWNLKITWKFMNFSYIKFPIVQKSYKKKECIQNHPYVIRKWFFGFLEKIIRWIFLFKFPLLLKKYFYVFFWKILKMFGQLKYLTPPQLWFFFDIFCFWLSKLWD